MTIGNEELEILREIIESQGGSPAVMKRYRETPEEEVLADIKSYANSRIAVLESHAKEIDDKLKLAKSINKGEQDDANPSPAEPI